MKIPTILIVDDEQGQRENVRAYFEPRIRCTIAEASNGEEAIGFIKTKPCDVMILDIKMPEKGGLEVLDVAKDLPISTIVFTGWDSEEVYHECKKRGVKEYIPKGGSLKVIGTKTIKELKRREQYFPLT